MIWKCWNIDSTYTGKRTHTHSKQKQFSGIHCTFYVMISNDMAKTEGQTLATGSI